MSEDEASVNIPSLLTLAVVSFFVIRWFLNRDGSPGPGDGRSRRRNVVDPAHVEQISQMFPQLSTRDIIWDLQRNGGSVAATTERILTGRGLDTVSRPSRLACPLARLWMRSVWYAFWLIGSFFLQPPPSFQPQIAVPSAAGAGALPAHPVTTTPSKSDGQDLISRYNLTSRVDENTTESTDSAPASASTWSQNKDERHRLLQKRRDDMILAARRKMMQKD